MTERHSVSIHIVMDESGAFVVADDPEIAIELAEEELGEDAEVRQVALTIELLPPSQSPGPIKATCRID
jgi:hypothetical protein